ncbi:cation:proton antiporter regulatory subunit [Arthrobacter agilis]|uniref:cation:proton antiporter regulatory subunit n=1 Tax=Arthrobacter agilis TaxID=37921 RepID=UPI000B35C809|nr:TrkA C-terminal domain-containing protein [Arthrobacter agilis]OUM40436.1 potassium transporter TrkA [Arthrobacter agilis]PPB45051.1 potassium transporter TrkA [Arthrobacter agilis]TPV27754.1 cation:proton antiporter regulatory subunit [Arthrobacter agilis]WDF34325.1 TrkA C-terminal domain-containing protein [Arthrobacter agilis]VDR31600.1 K(+)/H(+) antiporter subunit khtT [Arthrobacter agilis]
MNVIETRLPGIGVRREIVTGSGRRVGIVAQRDGDLDLIISKAGDPDACVASIPLTPDEAATIGNLLGSRQLVAQLTEEHRDLPGVSTRQFMIERGSPFDGHRLADTRMRSRSGASLVAVLRAGQVQASPTPDFTLASGDLLVVVGTSEGLDAAADILRNG